MSLFAVIHNRKYFRRDLMSGRATAIFVGAREQTIPAHNLPSQKPAPTGILWLIDRT